MNRIQKALFLVLGLVNVFVLDSHASGKKDAGDRIPTVETVDFSRFAGTWYEISRIPIAIARDWVNTRDVYVLKDSGKWEVRYEGNKGSDNGPLKVLTQRLRIPNPERPGEMEVSFLPLVWLPYRLLYVSEDYRFMIVGSSSEDLLWIMSKEALPADGEYERVTAIAADFGYDITRLERVPQSGTF